MTGKVAFSSLLTYSIHKIKRRASNVNTDLTMAGHTFHHPDLYPYDLCPVLPLQLFPQEKQENCKPVPIMPDPVRVICSALLL